MHFAQNLLGIINRAERVSTDHAAKTAIGKRDHFAEGLPQIDLPPAAGSGAAGPPLQGKLILKAAKLRLGTRAVLKQPHWSALGICYQFANPLLHLSR